MTITDMSLKDMSAALADKQFSSLEATQEHLERIEKLNPQLGAYISVTAKEALAAAEASDKRRSQGASKGVLDGIPMALKDIISTNGIATTCASRILEN